MGARMAVVEMPPGPPILDTIVAEVYGPDADTRRQVATDLLAMFDQVEDLVDSDSYMAEPYTFWRFEVATEKAVRLGVSVDTINGSLAMAMGSYKLGDIKRGTVLEPTYIIMQIPLAVRSQVSRLGDLPIPTSSGSTIPLSELGQFVKDYEDPVIYTKDLRDVEYVVGEMEGFLGAPIYGMFSVEDLMKEYTTPDGVIMSTMPATILARPGDTLFMGMMPREDPDNHSGIEWTGEWTVTYETFRDMGGAFMAALILIYGLIVWEFKNFALAGLIMSPIPVTMLGIVPGHWIMGAEFTATSMIGMIALGGIIVRQSILMVEFVKLEVAKGHDVTEAAVRGAEMRMRPILITSLTLMAGAFAILDDPIFNGMAISLMFGAGVSTVMCFIIIPMGCISARKQFYVETADDGTVSVSAAFAQIEKVSVEEGSSGPGLLARLWGLMVSLFSWVFILIKAVFTMVLMGFQKIFGGGSGGGTPPPPREGGGTPPPPRPPGGGTPPPPRETPPGGGSSPPPRETPPSKAKGSSPPPRETPPSKAKGSSPPPRETPVSKAGGTSPPPREMPPSKVKGTPPPPRETPPSKVAETAPAAEETPATGGTPPPEVPSASKTEVPESLDEPVSEEDTDGVVGNQRRGIRLKQDLS